MSSLNKVQLIGHLGADPEIRSLQNGSDVANLRVATSESWKDKEGNRKERTEWHTVTIFNPHLVATSEKFLRKGAQIYVEGKLQTRKWQDKDGNDRYSTEIVIERFGGDLKFLDKREQGEKSENSAPDRRDNRTDDRNRSSGRDGGYSDDYGDDIPF